MKKQLCSIGMGALLAVGIAIGAPAPQENGGAPPPDAGHGPRRGPDPARQVKMMTKKLNLSDDQQKQVLGILTDRQQQFESIRSDSSLSPQDRHAKMQSLRDDTETKITSILNDDQKAKYEKMRQEMRERMQQRRSEGGQQGGDNPPPPPQD